MGRRDLMNKPWSYELTTRTFQTLCEVNPSNGAFPGLLAMIRARHCTILA